MPTPLSLLRDSELAKDGEVSVYSSYSASAVETLQPQPPCSRQDACCMLAASRNNDLRALEDLLLMGVDVDIPGDRGWDRNSTALFVAAEAGHSTVIEYLISRGADKSRRCKFGWTPLYMACKKSNGECVSTLLQLGCSVDQRDNSGWTPLHAACQSCCPDVISILLASGASISAKSEGNLTPLYIASEEGSVESVALLLAAGADPNESARDGRGPVFVAAREGYVDVLSLLIGAGGDASSADEDGFRPLHAAAASGHVECILQLLSVPGVGVDDATHLGKTAVMLASNCNMVVAVKVLTDAGASTKLRVPMEVTKICARMYENYPVISSILVENTVLELSEDVFRGCSLILNRAEARGLSVKEMIHEDRLGRNRRVAALICLKMLDRKNAPIELPGKVVGNDQLQGEVAHHYLCEDMWRVILTFV